MAPWCEAGDNAKSTTAHWVASFTMHTPSCSLHKSHQQTKSECLAVHMNAYESGCARKCVRLDVLQPPTTSSPPWLCREGHGGAETRPTFQHLGVGPTQLELTTVLHLKHDASGARSWSQCTSSTQKQQVQYSCCQCTKSTHKNKYSLIN